VARQRKPSPAGRFGRVLLRVSAVLLVAWVAGLAWFMLAQPRAASIAEKTDGVVVLTGGPGRLSRGMAVLEAGSARRLLVSGVDRDVTKAQFAQANGVPDTLMACCIELGYVAETTRGNAREVAAFAGRHGFGSLRIVTAGYHMPRALAEVEEQVPPSVALLADAVNAPLPSAALIREYHKLLASRALLLIGRTV
jgi:uncharacterized SAM-binding protein YcdF (DUF218 family)